jgi:O-antigen ligase
MELFFYIGLMFFGILAAVNIRLGACFILALLPTYLLRTDIFSIPTTWLELAIYIIFIIWLVQTIFNKQLIIQLRAVYQTYHPLIFILGLWLASAIVATIISPDLRLSAGVLKGWWFDPLLFIFLLLALTQTKPQLKNLLLCLLLGAGLVAGYGIIEYIFNFGRQADGLLNSFYKPANYVALFIVPIVILSFPLLKTELLFKKKIYFALLGAICLVALWFTKSYGGFLGLTAGAGVLLLFIPGLKLKIIVPAFFIIFIIGVGILSTQPKFKNIISGSERNSLTTRLQIWEISIEVLKQHPVLGVGLGNFQSPYRTQAYKMYQPPLEWEVVKAHNLYLNLWLEMGLAGLITFAGMLILFAREIKKLLQSKLKYELWWLTGSSAAAMTTTLVHGLLDTPFFKNDLSILFLFIFCLPFLLNKIKLNQEIID